MNVSGAEFRRATEEDIPLLQELADRVWRACYREMLTVEQIDYMLGWMYSEEAIRNDVDAGVVYEIVEQGGRPIGYLAFGPGDDPQEWKLHKLYLLPEFHGQGLGRQSLDHVCASVSARSAKSLILNVNKNNARALRSYERAGFRIVRSVVNDIGRGFVMDDHVLQRLL